jgi:MscS family membrane protein
MPTLTVPMKMPSVMKLLGNYVSQRPLAFAFSLLFVVCQAAWPQIAAPVKPAAPDNEAQPEIPKDKLGRNTPRGAVVGFLSTVRKGNLETAVLYLNTPLHGRDAEGLARQLATVLDRRLPARLNELSDEPDGSVPDPLRPDEDLVGTITTANGDLDIKLERIDRGKAGKVWLFARNTLNSIPGVFQELNMPPVENFLPGLLVKTRLATIPLYEWLAVFIGIPFLYMLTGLLGRAFSLGVGVLRRRIRGNFSLPTSRVLPAPVRLILVALIIRWLLTVVGLSLLARQFWSTTSFIIATVACVWLLLLFNGWGERHLVSLRPGISGSAAVLRLLRRVMDGVILFAGLMFTLHHFGINPTAALAGLGVGGIAIALAAQKTLENVIAGISLIADGAVCVGDALKIGDVVGTIEEVGLRSTRIRTLDRTVLWVPNGQIANMSLEKLSVRDKFWFHPVFGLRYETTTRQLHSLMADIRKLVTSHTSVDSASVHVRLLRLGPFSLDMEIVAFILARDWNQFLEIQQGLLLSIIDIIRQAGTDIAIPSQTLYLSADYSAKEAGMRPLLGGKRRGAQLQPEPKVSPLS